MLAGTGTPIGLDSTHESKAQERREMSSSRVLRLGETFGDVTNVLYVQRRIVEDCLDWELFASQMRHRYIHLRP